MCFFLPHFFRGYGSILFCWILACITTITRYHVIYYNIHDLYTYIYDHLRYFSLRKYGHFPVIASHQPGVGRISKDHLQEAKDEYHWKSSVGVERWDFDAFSYSKWGAIKIKNPRSSSQNFIGFSEVLVFFHEKPMQEPRSLYGIVGEKNLQRSRRCSAEIEIAGAVMFGRFWDR